MELLEGETLAARIERGPLLVTEVIQIALALLAALHELHRRELVHRDLKPSNTFLTSNGVKLIDFGLARPTCRDGSAPKPNSDTPGLLVGTPRYMSPEQLLGHAATPVSDLFAAGAILFEMLSRRPAFQGRSVGRNLPQHPVRAASESERLFGHRVGGPRDSPRIGERPGGAVSVRRRHGLGAARVATARGFRRSRLASGS